MSTSSSSSSNNNNKEEFYLRYYTGTRSFRTGHEFLEFEIRVDGKLRYANNSGYGGGNMIRKEVYLNDCVVEEFKKMVKDSEILECDDFKWPEPVDAQEGSQELEIVCWFIPMYDILVWGN
eukprot:TRINITY_DN370_c1_g1_i6.p1 TRINITY_DN370_c1_g1~~TRINITY_DN370_c1_g1_i6.p1  ORF type:complete len:131 (+),score=41.23 TRINITY_DN370_c1_g1_i6:33-395(+)